jgi:hypothetical protein
MANLTKSDRTTEINKLHQEVCNGVRTTVQKAIRIGELLVEQKAESGHGNWIPWIEANLEFTRQTATTYIRAYLKWGNGKCLSI